MSDDSTFILQSLKSLDRERYLAALYLPQSVRKDIATLWAFDAEIARIPDLVSEPMPGEIRIQWWRDLIRSGDNAGSGPLAKSLVETLQKHTLPLEVLDTYLDARIFDLYQDPMPDTGTLEGYLGETTSSLFQLAALCTGEARSTALADACGHAGMAQGLTRILSQTARHRTRSQIFLPLDRLAVHETTPEIWLSTETGPAHQSVISDHLKLVESHFEEAKSAIRALSKDTQTVFLPLATIPAWLKVLKKNGFQCLTQPVSLSALRQHWELFRAATGSFR